ncbi:MAG TPA: hypothetical protein VKM54_18255 [Myxococcota bacterium]|nr:hypothetical protein [Myxococcota bacterium]
MADSVAFDRACELLKQHTTFSEIEARGTVRLALKTAGQNPKTVGKTERMRAVRSALEPERAAWRMRPPVSKAPGWACSPRLE